MMMMMFNHMMISVPVSDCNTVNCNPTCKVAINLLSTYHQKMPLDG